MSTLPFVLALALALAPGRLHVISQTATERVLWDPEKAQALRVTTLPGGAERVETIDGRPATSATERAVTKLTFADEPDVALLIEGGAHVSGGLLVSVGHPACEGGARCVVWKAVSPDGRELLAWALVDAVSGQVVSRDPAELGR